MSCDPKIIETRQFTNEIVGYRVVCCEEDCCLKAPCRDGDHDCCTPEAHTCESSWHTVSIHREDHDAYMQERLAEVAKRHEKMKAWRAKNLQN